MKEFDKRIFRNQIFLPKEHCPGEAALVDITADRYNVLMQKFSDFFYCVEGEIEAHSSPKILFNWFLVSKLRDLIFPSTKREAQAGVLFASSAIFTWLKLLSMHQSMNFFINLPSSFLFMVINIIAQ